jgi:polar amino acid transport system permease protein
LRRKALGFGYWNSMRYVILPQAARNMFPSFVTMGVDTTKMSAVASAIAYPELLYKGQLVAGTFYRPIEAYTGVAVIFIVIIGGFTIAMDWVERRLTKYGTR